MTTTPTKKSNNLQVCLITTNTSDEPSFVRIRDSKRPGRNQATFEDNVKQMIIDNNSPYNNIIQTATDNFIIFSEQPHFQEVKSDEKKSAEDEEDPNAMDVEEQNAQNVVNTPNEVATFILRGDSTVSEVLYGKCLFLGIDEDGKRSTLNPTLIALLKDHRKYFKRGPKKTHSAVYIYGNRLRSKTLPRFKNVKKLYNELPAHEQQQFEDQARNKYGNKYSAGDGFKIYHRVNHPELTFDAQEEFNKLPLSDRQMYEAIAQQRAMEHKTAMRKYEELKPPTKPPNVKASTLYYEMNPNPAIEFKELPKNSDVVKKYKLLARQKNHQIKLEYRETCRRVGRKFNPKWEQDINKYKITGKKRKRATTTNNTTPKNPKHTQE